MIITFNNNITYDDNVTFNISNIKDINNNPFSDIVNLSLDKIDIISLEIHTISVDKDDNDHIIIKFNKDIKFITDSDISYSFSITDENNIVINDIKIEQAMNTNNNDEMKIKLDRVIKVETSQLEGESEGQIFLNYNPINSDTYIEDIYDNRLPIINLLRIRNELGDGINDIFPPECISVEVFDNEKDKLILTFNEDMETNTTIFNKYSFTLSDSRYIIESGNIIDNKINLILNNNIQYGDIFSITYKKIL